LAVLPPNPPDLPLNALRAFEAAARLGGFLVAARELGVTPGAVTAHVKSLEALLGARLFDRTAKGVTLTAIGQQALPGLTAAFDAMANAARDLREAAAPQVVQIATLPAIAQLWLSPRMPALRALAPGITISITAMEQPPNLKRAVFDLCLFYRAGTEGAIGPDVIFPVCAPDLAKQLARQDDILQQTCLSDALWDQDWPQWMRAMAVKGVVRGPVFSLYALAVEEAVNGAGVLMAHDALVDRHLAEGRLVAPFADKVTLPRHLCLWSARPLRRGTAADLVAKYLKGQAKAA
jgi:DNA-binding transcriptional LysR family regulator